MAEKSRRRHREGRSRIRSLKRKIDPFALKAAVRAAIVMPAVFGFADGLIRNADTTLFAAFGSFAILVLADFGGPPGRRLAAYLSLAAIGAVLIALGTLCSQTDSLAVAGVAAIGFAVLFARVLGGHFASGAFAAMLVFIVSLAVPGPVSAIPDRLAGWFLAAAVGITATMVLWPTRRTDRLRADAAEACRALGDMIDPDLGPDRSSHADKVRAASSAASDLRRRFVSTPLRPTSPTGPTEALAFMVDALEWLLTVAAPAADSPGRKLDPCPAENGEVSSAAAAVLRASAENLEGRRQQLPLGQLEHATDVVEGLLALRIGGRVAERGVPALLEVAEPSFRMREISLLTREIGINALRAVGAAAPEPGSSRARRTRDLLLAHATPRSASFRNSLRGAIGLAAAVFVIQIASVQHGFWVILATLSVLRSTALGTGSTIFQALAGTTFGIAVGGVLIYAIGANDGVLWAVLPAAVLLAAYASLAMPLAAGQGGFTVTVLVIYNLIAPTGWTLGLVRVEDVAIGCAIGLTVGSLFWPRGIESLLRESLGAAYARAADYVASAARWIAGGAETGSSGDAVRSAREEARSAAARLDDAFRQYLAEPTAQRADVDSLATLVSGAIRVRLAAYSLSTLPPAQRPPPFDRCADALASEAGELRAWYASLGDAVARRQVVDPPQLPSGGIGCPVVRCVSDALGRDRDPARGPALSLLWADRHLAWLWRLGAQLADQPPDSGKPPTSAT